MPLNFDVRNFTDAQREQLAWRIHEAGDWKLPKLRAWNYDLCRIHARGWDEEIRDIDGEVKTRKVYDRPKPGCRKCGIHFRKHQHLGVAWLYFKKNALLADTMGPQPLSASVLTPYGYQRLGDLRAGDEVIDPATGGTTFIEEVIPQGLRQVYEVTFTDGSSTRAADTHLWQVTTPDRKHHGRPPLIRTTQQLLDAGIDYSNGNHRWYIPLTAPVELESGTPLGLDPYTVGVLLGDGYAGGSVMLSTDREIVENLVLPEGVEPVLVATKEVDYSADFRLRGLKPVLTSRLTLTSAESKRVPREYLLTSAANRIALLQGLLDTDGTSAGTSTIEWGTVSAGLAEDMAFLINSLGGTFSRSEKVPTFTYKGEVREGQRFYRFHIALPSTITPFRLARKAARHTPATKYEPTRGIVSITPVGVQEVRCIRVASESHLYLTDDFIVTHNSGKTTHAGGLIAMLIETGELSLYRDRSNRFGGMGRVIICPRSPALHQWRDELLRMLPSLNVLIAEGTKKQRTQYYLQPWQVLLIGPEMLRNDYQLLENFDLAALITDDIDQLRNATTETSYVLDRLGGRGVEGLSPGTNRYVIMSGTPLQKRLPELHSVLDGIGGLRVLGDMDSFTKRHVRWSTVTEYNKRTGRDERRNVVVGYRDLETVKARIAPMVLRRTAADLDDVNLPTIIPNDVMLDLYPAQRRKYDELRKGVIKIMREEGVLVKRPEALAKIHYGAAICAGLAALGEADGPGTSMKLDWVMEQVSEDGDLGEEKVVVFANLKHDQPLDSLVLTPTGWVRMGDLRQGDSVISADGSQTAITGVMPKGVNQVYRLTFDDGTTAESSENHLWQFRSGRKRYVRGSGRSGTAYAHEEWRVGSLRELMDAAREDAQTAQRGPSKYYPQVPMLSAPVQYATAAKPLPLHPYLLGVLLGDGWMGRKQEQPGFCTTEPEIAERVRAVLPDGVTMREHSRRRDLVAYRFGGTTLVEGSRSRRNIIGAALDELGLTGASSYTKFIPDPYKIASVEERGELVRGLMDTDGNERGQLVVVSERLASDLADVARSLGAWASFRSSRSGSTPTFTTMIATNSFDIAHLNRKKYRTGSRLVKRVISVEPSRSVETQCLEVAHPSHLYVTDGMTLTHNTVRALQLRMRRSEIGFVTVWGDEPDKKKRAEAQERFWTDPKCRILIGTRAIEQSLNLQVSRHLINVDMILNPARMEQLAGRIRRDGSAYQHVYVHNLLTVRTQEERYLPMLEREAALAAHIWDEDSQLFAALPPMALLQLISG